MTEDKKEIKDYIHLYLGAKIKYRRPDDKYYTVTEITQTTIGYRYSDMKIILRPLSDMTEEECREITGYNKVQEGRELLKFEKEQNLAVLEYRWRSAGFSTDDGYAYSSTAIYFDKEEWSPENFLYLLSKHFDLFGLCEAGIAIDKATLKP